MISCKKRAKYNFFLPFILFFFALTTVFAQQEANVGAAGVTPGSTAPAAGAAWAPPTPAATQDDFDDDRIEALERLAKLHATGALTDAEFAAEKRRVLGG